MADRRYSDDEISAIFRRATEVQQRAPQQQLPQNEGMSLAELQSIGREAGIAPELVAQAARELDQPALPRVSRLFGIPTGVARTIRLERRLTDDEWDALVVQLRDTFQARGTITVQGAFRTWSNGNLHVLVEPHGDGQVVRFRTTHGNARGAMVTGVVMTAVTAVSFAAAGLAGPEALSNAVENLSSLFIIGGAFFAIGSLQLPRWLKTRRIQMDELAERLLRITGAKDQG
jgi:hypothetical protein